MIGHGGMGDIRTATRWHVAGDAGIVLFLSFGERGRTALVGVAR